MQKKIPQRQCMGCRERKAKRDMIRVVRGTDGTVSLDFSGKVNGRGAYICPDMECLKKAQRAKSLERSLETAIPEEVYQRLAKEMEAERAMDKALSYLALARKAGKAELGEEPVGAITRAGKGVLVLVASDASEHTWRRAMSFVAGTSQQCLRIPYSKDDMGQAIGRTSLAIAAISDPALALALVKALPESKQTTQALEALTARTNRARQCRKEAKAHEKNKRVGKSRRNAAVN